MAPWAIVVSRAAEEAVGQILEMKDVAGVGLASQVVLEVVEEHYLWASQEVHQV